ncbi:hypothetical protein DOTSEDRAFT_35820 [Dothistroma septosporum NZE10]|uniref:C2H2-type domain-containing protein n=1 Tax=Dothistroma septosporum (strain NZE10 / CBS 128990) TaxID=675120 RepID=M2Y5R1_DOTSN|nr:hypothetical protein DOTSEDRAFT_35820 [Dothistroma septosporum NZE10]
MALSTARHFCSVAGCSRNYPLRKSLNRHVRTIHEGQIFACKDCSKTFSRKDHRNRHEDETHCRLTRTVRCSSCDKVMLVRTLGDHLKTHAHIEAESGAISENCLIIKDCRLWNSESLVDPLLLTSWLFCKMNLDSITQGSWDMINMHCRPTVQVLELRGFAMRTLGTIDIENYDLTRLVHSVEALMMTDAMIGNSEAVEHHKPVLHELRRRLTLGRTTSSANTHQDESLSTVVDDFRDLSCASVPSGPVTGSDSWYYKSVTRRGCACERVQDPADRTIETINNVAIEYEETPTNCPDHSYEHELKSSHSDAEALKWCWSSRQSAAAAALSGPTRLIRRNMHAFLCASTRTTFDTNAEVRCPIQKRLRRKAELRALVPSSATNCVAWLAQRTHRRD